MQRQKKQQQKLAKAQVSLELGHSRTEIFDAYGGSSTRGKEGNFVQT